MKNKQIECKRFFYPVVGVLLVILTSDVWAHGERAQLASMRMRTVHWFDLNVSPLNVKVGDIVTVTGKFYTSDLWPNQLPTPEDTVYLNIGVPGPTFIKLDASVNEVPMVRSTAFELGKVFEYRLVMRARIPGRYHVHSLMNVKDAGSLVGKGTWVEVAEPEGAAADQPFINEVTTLTGETIDLEQYGLGDVYFWHVVWIFVGVAYLLYWLMRRELFIPRFIRIREMGQDKADSILTKKDFIVSACFFTGTLALMLGSYLWAENKYPITIPLQTGKVDVAGYDAPKGDLEIEVESARYELAGRSLTINATLTNKSSQVYSVGEFLTANIRFINPNVKGASVYAGEEMVAADGLTVTNKGLIAPGESLVVEMVASDALWEQYRMTGLINDPDSRFAGLLFYFDEDGNRYYQEIGGPILPKFF